MQSDRNNAFISPFFSHNSTVTGKSPISVLSKVTLTNKSLKKNEARLPGAGQAQKPPCDCHAVGRACPGFKTLLFEQTAFFCCLA